MSVRYVFNTNGDYVAFVTGGNLFSPNAEWIGFIRNGNEVYSTKGDFSGYLLDDDRIVKNINERKTKLPPPFKPFKPFTPFRPLRRLRMPALPHPYHDVFADKPTTSMPSRHKVISNFDHLLGANLQGADGVFLGTISRDPYKSDSISNIYGSYGSPYNSGSIFNQYGRYGSAYSAYSPFNSLSTYAPRIVLNDTVIGYLTVNEYLKPKVDPNEFLKWLGRN